MFLETFWRNDLRDEIFVAMSFDKKFDIRWERIFKPSIEDKFLLDRQFKAVRVDIRKSGDSILTEITSGIAHAQLVLADISVTDERKENGNSRWYRNENVMYEVGLALACRQPAEVILARDDDQSILFDLSHIPVLRFNPDDVDASVETIRDAFIDRLRDRDLVKDARVMAALESLTQFEIKVIRELSPRGEFGWQGSSLPEDVVMALPRLLDKRILRLLKLACGSMPDMYAWTTFGRAIADHLISIAG